MILRTFGLILLALSCAACGWWAGRRSKKADCDLELLCLLLEHVRREIAYSRRELPLCFSSFFQAHPHPSEEDFIAGRYESALRAFSLKKEQKDDLLSFFLPLGSSNAADEVKRCDVTLDKLKNDREKSRMDLPQKTKTCVTLGICAGAVILLLFL